MPSSDTEVDVMAPKCFAGTIGLGCTPAFCIPNHVLWEYFAAFIEEMLHEVQRTPVVVELELRKLGWTRKKSSNGVEMERILLAA